ncbi:hypothetical protein [Parasitella parasitica]|uniref:VTC domain-containing protein n=1 Tax=Parasitella parasitica TaxID=35722 RepID=A0A0B7N2Q9_9FUNG|nr:hypothetical protein [Parasitella parasitica]
MTSPLVALKKPFSLLEQYDITAFINTLQQDFARAETDHDSHVAPPQQQTSINNDAFKGGNVGLSSSPSSSCSTHSCDTILSSETTQPQPQHRRKTYWVHPHNVLELILYLSDKMMVSCGGDVSHLPVVQEIGYPAGMTNATESQYRMTTVYMDTPHLTAYNNTSSMARVRWYESMNASSRSEEAVTVTEASHAMVEQKKYDSHTKQCWIQQRVWLKSKHLELWLSGSFSLGSMLSKESCQYHKDGYSANVDDIHEMQKSCLAVETEIHTRQIIPVLKVTKNRLVYASLDHSVTISIDTDIAMMRASSAKEPQSEQYPYNGLCLDDIVRFPYCVIQINTSTDNAKNSNKWLMDLMECSMLVSADGFSTYIHGVQALLGQQRLEIPLPSWNSVDLDGYCLHGCLLAQAQKQKQQQQQLGSDAKSHGSLQTLSGSSSRGSSRRDMHNRSTDTIATIITCYDDEMNEKQPTSLVESPTAIESPLLHPPDGQQQQRSGMRRSFDSYCSFDHPTSSRSDPTNCKSCIGRMSFGEHQSIDMRQHLPIASVYEKETITFSSFLLQTFWPRKFRSFEKEPLLASQHKRHRSATSGTYGIGGASRASDRSASRVLQATLQGERFSRAAIFTMTCVVVSFSMSCILYITVLAKL